MKTSQLTIKPQEQSIDVVELSKGTTGELALVNLDIMRQLLSAHAIQVSLFDLKERMIDKLKSCRSVEEYESILSYDLGLLQMHRNLKAYEDAKMEEKNR